MYFTPSDIEKLQLATAAMVARKRLERGIKLNYPEAIALISDFIIEGARDGRPLPEVKDAGSQVLRKSQVMEGIAEMIPEISVEATFPTGTHLVVVVTPISD